MDTKSKNSKAFSYLTALIWIMLAVAAFLAFYPGLGKEAERYYTNQLRSDGWLEQMYQGNLVLYRDMLERKGQESVSYADLFLQFEEEEITEEELEDSGYAVEEQTMGSMKVFFQENLNSILENWKLALHEDLSRHMDYCVMDHETGEILKNTDRSIEKLAEKDSAEDYCYYVRMDYDREGNLSNVSVRDEAGAPDELLKNVKSVMAEDRLKRNLNDRTRYDTDYRQEFYFDRSFNHYDGNILEEYLDEGNEIHPVRLRWRINDGPKDMTFIYALTEQQRQDLLSLWQTGASYTLAVSASTVYYMAGAGEIYAAILLLLALAALLMTRCKRYCLHHLPGFHMSPEISLCGGALLLGIGMEWETRMIYCTNNGFFDEFYRRYLTALPVEGYPALTIVVNVLALFIQFGFMYYLVTTFGEIFDLGVIGFVKERSILVRLGGRFVCWCRKWKERFQEEILHVDLGGNTEKTIRKLLLINLIILAAACTMWMFGYIAIILYTIVLYFLLKKYLSRIQEQYRQLFVATRSIADGNLQTEFDSDWGVFESYKQELSRIQNGFRAAVDKEVKSQKMKTELITNVSHDLKTPLTAITTYIELLEDEGISVEQRREYLSVLKRKSERLKFLIEDLFEVSKASSGNITLNPVEVDICNLMRQVYLEYEDRVEEAGLIFRFRLPEEKVILKLDSQKTYRVFENLYTNIIKYAMPRTRVYVNGEKTEKGIAIELKNMSATELDIAPEELTERFVRGDSSRNTEGSGLGLAIARSFVELQGGQLKVEIDGDLFKVRIEW